MFGGFGGDIFSEFFGGGGAGMFFGGGGGHSRARKGEDTLKALKYGKHITLHTYYYTTFNLILMCDCEQF